MRIDYSEPKQAYVSGQQANRSRKEQPAGAVVVIVGITALVTFAAGFGTGWFLSQRSAKKAFQAALAQTSLESPGQAAKQAAQPPQPQPVQPAPAAQPSPPGQAPAATTPEPPLSFYKALPSGQKSAALGSGINAREDKSKQPLQAAIPSNVARQADQEQPVLAEKPAVPAKPASKDGDGFTVQIGSYSLKSEAEGQRSKLAAKGYNVSISESNQGDKGIWYRVRVGRKLDQAAAKELAGKFGKSALVLPDRD